MENVLKNVYKKIEDKLFCACLVHRDMKIMVKNYILEQKPYLPKIEAERRAEVVLKNSHEEYKHERNRIFDVVRRSFRKVTKSEALCKCPKNIIYRSSSKVKPAENSRGYEELDETDEECRCHITCAQQNIANILKPLETFVTTNRGTKLRWKHLDKERYEHLDADGSAKFAVNERTIIDSQGARSTTSNNCFAVKIEDSSKRLQHMFGFGRTAPASFEESTKENEREYKSNATGSSNVRSHTFAKEMQSTKVGNNDEDAQNAIKITHCDNHCFLCMLEKGFPKETQLVYCKYHYPKCTPFQMEVIANNSLVTSDIVTAKVSTGAREKYRYRSKSETKVAGRSDKNVPKQIGKKRRRVLNNSGNKANVRKMAAEDEITLVKDDTEALNLNDSLEWDSFGLDAEKQWGNTLTALDDIKENHVSPIQDEINDMQQYFRSLLTKYKPD